MKSNTTKSHSGFSVIEVSIVIAVIVLAAALGWVFYQNTMNQEADVTKSSETQSASTGSETAPHINKTDDLGTAEKYLNSTDIDKDLNTSDIDSSLSKQ